MESLGMMRAVARARLSDEPGAPVVEMPLDDAAAGRYAALMADLAAEFAELEAGMADGGADPERVARLYRRVLRGCVGKGGYKAAVRHVRAGADVPAGRMNALLTPLVVWCVDNIRGLLAPVPHEAQQG